MFEVFAKFQYYVLNLAAVVLVTFLGDILLVYILNRRFTSVSGVPHVGLAPEAFGQRLKQAQAEFIENSKNLVQEGYLRFKGSKFQVQTADLPRIVLSLKYLNDLRALPQTILSHCQALCDCFAGDSHGLETIRQNHIHSDVCRNQFVQNLATVLPFIQDEIEHVVNENITSQGGDAQKRSLNAQEIMFAIVSRANSRLFLGLPSARSQDWLQASSRFPAGIIAASQELLAYSNYIRPSIEPFLASTKRVKHDRERFEAMITPLLAERKLAREAKNGACKHQDLHKVIYADPDSFTARYLLFWVSADLRCCSVVFFSRRRKHSSAATGQDLRPFSLSSSLPYAHILSA